MSKENLNDFYERNRFNRKLRERIDHFEPELSDSLWDRIEAGLQRNEEKNKRVLWLVYTLSALLLVVSGGLFYLWDENQRLAGLYENPPAVEQAETPPFVFQSPEVQIRPGNGESENPGARENGNPDSRTEHGAENTAPGNAYQYTAPVVIAVPDEHPGVSITDQPVDVEIENGLETQEDASETLPSLWSVASKAVSGFSLSPQRMEARYLKETYRIRAFANVHPYLALHAEAGSSRQRLSHNDSLQLFSRLERPMQYTSVGLSVGFRFNNGFFIESGLQYTGTGTNYWYNLKPLSSPIPTPSPSTMLVGGNRHAVARQFWIEVPLQAGYEYGLGPRFLLSGRGGFTYSMINAYGGMEPNRNLDNIEAAGTSHPQPFRNFMAWNAGLGAGYRVNSHWSVHLEANYRRGLTRMNTVNQLNYPDRKLEAASGRIGVRYSLR